MKPIQLDLLDEVQVTDSDYPMTIEDLEILEKCVRRVEHRKQRGSRNKFKTNQHGKD